MEACLGLRLYIFCLASAVLTSALKCSNPPCTNPNCRYCKTCKDAACRERTGCAKSLYASRVLPRNRQDFETFWCSGCLWTHCEKCGESTQSTSIRLRRLAFRKRWTCVNCMQKQLTNADKAHKLKKHDLHMV